MSKAAPTNADIINAVTGLASRVGRLESETDEQHRAKMQILEELTAQVKYTNGQVRSLNQWRSNQEAVEKYKKNNPTPTIRVNNNFQWDWKTIITAGAIIIVALFSLFTQLGGTK